MFSLSKLTEIEKSNPKNIRDLWSISGSLTCNSNTRIYNSGTFLKIAEGPLQDYIVYCVESSTSKFDWTNTSITALNSFVSLRQGTELPYFRIVLTKDELDKIADTDVDENLDLSIFEAKSTIQISDEDLTNILTEEGVPFVSIDELEYNRQQICDIVVKPTLHFYFERFPLVTYYEPGYVAAGSKFRFKFPEHVHGAMAWTTIGAGTGTSGGYSSVREFITEQYTMGGRGSSSFNRAINYRKSVPGYTGQQYGGAANGFLSTMLNQAYSNLYRREVVHIERIDGNKYVTGHTTIGGSLCIAWLGDSDNWDDIDYEFYTDAIKYAKGLAMVNIGALRNLIKSDVPANMSDSNMKSEGQNYMKEVADAWNDSSNKLALGGGIHRGGLN